jgi:RNA polymerase sigma factor (sigma-70 family)
MNPADQEKGGGRRASFDTTRWSMVLAVGDGDTVLSREALAELCRRYWMPLYTYVRRRGHGVEEAEDLVQEFFARLLASNSIERAEPERGKFRTYLLSCLDHFLANEWDKAHAQKRGGGQTPFSLDFSGAESRLIFEPADPHAPDTLYEKQWALSLIDQVLARLHDEACVAGTSDSFEHLKVFLTAGTGNISYEDLAVALGRTEGAARTAVYRLRRRYREALREEVSQTVENEEDIDGEIRYLMGALSL